ncbi:MAG: hypothetical protein U1F43_30080 [Myxococcota bacterium]
MHSPRFVAFSEEYSRFIAARLEQAGWRFDRTEAASRPCGACTACCTVMAVGELRKPAHVACVHLAKASAGCSIYPTRPGSCADFLCGWKAGLGDLADRPDQSGVILAGRVVGGWLFLLATLATPLAAASQATLAFLARLQRFAPIIVVEPDDAHHLVAAPGDAELARRLATLWSQATPAELGR